MSGYDNLVDEHEGEYKTASAPILPEEEEEARRAQIGSPPHSHVIHYNEDDDGVSEMICRNCHGGIEDGNDFIVPCDCKGSVKWVHRHCLDQWRIMSPNPDSFHRCELCLAEYEFEERNTFKCCNYLKYAIVCLLDFSVFIIIWQVLVAICCVIVLLADNGFVIADKVFGEHFPKVLAVWLLGNALFLFCLGVLGSTCGLAALGMKLFGACKGSDSNVEMGNYTYRHNTWYWSDFMMDYLFCWIICSRMNSPYYGGYYGGGFYSPGPIICIDCGSSRGPDCGNLDCGNTNSGDCGNLDCGSGGGGGSDAGGALAVIGIILLVVVVIFIVIGAIVGIVLLVFILFSIMNRRLYLITRRDRVRQKYVVDRATTDLK